MNVSEEFLWSGTEEPVGTRNLLHVKNSSLVPFNDKTMWVCLILKYIKSG